jgi:DHA1 family multidrug resistance protein-like MFS transporter
MMTMLSSNITGPILPLYAKDFTSELVLIGAVISGFSMIRFLVELPWGLISDVMGRKRPIILGMLLCMVGAVICSGATDAYQLIVARAIWGVGSASYFCVTIALIIDIAPPRDRGKFLGIFQGIEFVGSTVGASLCGVLTVLLGGYRQLFAVSAGLTFVAILLVLRIDVDQYGTRVMTNPVTVIKESVAHWRVLLNVSLLACSFSALAFAINNSGLLSTIFPLYVVDVLNYSIINLSFFMGARSVGMVFGTMAGGWLSDRLGGRVVLLVGFSIGAASVYGIVSLTTLNFLLGMLGLSGMAFGLIYSVLPNIVVRSVPPQMKGMAIGSYRTFMDLGSLSGPFLSTAIASSSGLNAPFYVMTLWLIASMIISTLLLQRQPQYREFSPDS